MPRCARAARGTQLHSVTRRGTQKAYAFEAMEFRTFCERLDAPNAAELKP